jgi:hypothetical protein
MPSSEKSSGELDHPDTHTDTTEIDDTRRHALATAAGDATLRAFADGGAD